MIRMLQSSWFVSLVGSLLYLGTTVLLFKPADFEGARAENRDSKSSPDNSPSWRFTNPEFDQWVNELRREREALSLREQELNELAARLESERQEMSVVTQSVMQLQAAFDRNVVRLKDQEVQNLKREVKVLGTMEPEAAVRLLTAMSDDDMVRVLYLMKPDQMAAMLEALSQKGPVEAKRAAAITEQMRRALPPEANARNASSF